MKSRVKKIPGLLLGVLRSFNSGYHRVLIVSITALMALIIVPVSLQILSRYTGIIPRYIWTEEVARFCFVWIIMIGAMIAVRDGTHFDVDLLPNPITKRSQGIRNLIVHSFIGAMSGIFIVFGIEFAQFGFIQSSEMSGINMATIYISFPLAGFTWLLFLIEKVVDDIRLIKHTSQMIEE
ncbi:MAG: TRAP transporter small permease [Verrucomicrobia bacterium]|nr:TRAP transporter small permease [Verrucomicrobiota bacterium]MDA1067883.1 TRAP transporter small permease [Verrucomicrobiota bacterium]